MKRGPQHFDAVEPRAKYLHEGTPAAPMCMKLLISAKEASSVLGPGGCTCREIGQQTGTKLHVSSRQAWYPGTNLQELTVKGADPTSVSSALMQVFGNLAQEGGRITCGVADYIVNPTVDLRGDWHEDFQPPSVDVKISQSNMICRSDGGTRGEDCSGVGWVIEAVATGDGLSIKIMVAMRGGFLEKTDNDVEEGGARVRFVVPVASAKALIGRGGENIRALRAQSGLYVHIEEFAIGMGDSAEQIVSLQGSLAGLEVALVNVVEKVAAFAGEPGFAAWASTSHAGSGQAMATQVAPGKAAGKGKGAGKQQQAYGGGGWSDAWAAAAGGEEALGGYTAAEDPYSSGLQAADPYTGGPQPATGEWGPSDGNSGMELIADAIQKLPQSMLSPIDRSKKVTFNCPAACVSAIIGKGGAGVKEIAYGTQTKIMIREIENNAEEKAVTITGNALGVVAAYLHVVGRITSFQEMAGEVPAGALALM